MVLRPLLVSALIALIATIPPPAASAETARACGPAPASLAKFEASVGAEHDEPIAFFIEGEQRTELDSYSGRGVVLNFWATWCAPCVKEMPALDALHAELAPAGIEVIALSSDFAGAEVVRTFYQTNGIENLAVAMDPKSEVGQGLGVPGLPTTVLFDAAGREVGRVVGAAEWDDPAAIRFLRNCLAPRA